MKKCFGYIRVSTVKQGEGVSLEAQKEAIQAFSERNDIEIIKWFEEKVTAAKKGRPLFNAMMQLLKKRQAAGLVFHKIDRSARNFTDWAKIGDLQDCGIDIHFATESLVFGSRGGRLTADIQAVIAADYVRNLREECIKGLNGRLKQGLYPFCAPIGYLDNGAGKPKTPDPIRAPLVRELFQLYASQRHSLISLRDEMAALGLKNRNDQPLSKNGVLTILDNPFYTGIIRIKKSGRTFPGKHERLISARLFERVQAIRSGRSFKKVTRHNHTFNGLFRCDCCKERITAELQRGKVYYRCHTKNCTSKTFREDILDSALLHLFNNFRHSLMQQDKLRKQLAKWFELENNSAASKASTELQLSALNLRMDRLTDAMIDRLIDQESFNQRRQNLLIEKERLESELSEFDKKSNNEKEIMKFLERVNNLGLQYQNLNRREKREFAKMMTSNRTVNGKKVVVEPQKWLHTIEFLLYVPFGGPRRDTFRTFNRKTAQSIEPLLTFCAENPILEDAA